MSTLLGTFPKVRAAVPLQLWFRPIIRYSCVCKAVLLSIHRVVEEELCNAEGVTRALVEGYAVRERSFD